MRPYLLMGCLLPVALSAQTVGLTYTEAANEDGYVLFAPIPSLNTYLLDKCGRQVHQWTGAYQPGNAVYLRDDGLLLRTGNVNNPAFPSGGKGGALQLLDPASTVTWSHLISDALRCQHHDAFPMPDGNVLAIAWEKKTVTEAIAAGRDPALLGTALWSEAILELQPVGADSAIVVWEWHLWDHLVQDFDPLQANHGVVADHPELVNINFIGGAPTQADWIHMNAVHFDPALDQIMLSAHNLDEIWVIDHGTTTAEAAAHAGGAHGRGGDLLYRWGNPQVYDRGTAADQKLFGQHSAHWIPAGLPDAGRVLIFNNGVNRPGGNYSTVDMIETPIDAGGNYPIAPGQPYGPTTLTWTWSATPTSDFYSNNISGAQRLPGGGALVCEGNKGEFFELDSSGGIIWRYINPVSNTGVLTQGDVPSNNSVFRATWLPVNHPGLSGLDLTPMGEIELDPLVPSLCVLLGQEEPDAVDARLFPNPASGEVTLRTGGKGTVEVTVFDATGRPVLTAHGSPGSCVMDVSRLSNGTYHVRGAIDARAAMRPLVVLH